MRMNSLIASACVLSLAGLAQVASAFVFFDPVLKWPTPTQTSTGIIKLQGINPNSPSGTSWNQGFQDSVDSWTSETVFNLNFDGSTASHPCAGLSGFPEEDFKNGVDFLDTACEEDFGNSTLAITITYYDPNTSEILESDIIFNNAPSWDIYDGSLLGPADFRRVALHEQGHFQGLGHEVTNPAIMKASIGNLFTLQADDIAGVQALYNAAGGLDSIVMSIESPFSTETKVGVSTFRGWVVSIFPLTSLQYFEDGVFKQNLSATGTRLDIAAQFPDYPDSENSGFAFAQNWAKLGVGSHTVSVTATDSQGNILSQGFSFTVDKFDTLFVEDDQVSMDSSTVSRAGEIVTIDNFLHAGKHYIVKLQWKKQSQAFDIISISPK